MFKLYRFLFIIIILQCIYPTHVKPLDIDYCISGQNTAQKIFVRSSSQYSINHRASKAIDADPATSWISASSAGPQWIVVDFGPKRIITSLIIRPGKKDNYWTFTRLTLQFLYHNTWFDFATVPTAKKGIGGSYSFFNSIEIDCSGIEASTFRILIPEDAVVNKYAAISEIETYIGSSKLKLYDARLKGMSLPIKNAYLPHDDYNYPNAPRSYRGGHHAGIDIYYFHTDDSYDPIPLTNDTPVFAADEGIIIRADTSYEPTTITEWNERSAYFMSHPDTFVKRSFGGRQIWIDHKNGIVTTYNHLSQICTSIKKGKHISKGDQIGWAGNSGLAGEAEGKMYGIHLHFEIWIDGFYLGYGMNLPEIKKYFAWIFFPGQ